MLRGEPLRDNASLRDFNEGEGARVADALEKSLLLPADMAELNSLTSEQVFLSLKRYVGMVGRGGERSEEGPQPEHDWCFQATQALKNSEADLTKAREELKAVTRERDSALSGLEGTQTQAKEQIRRLGEAEEQLQIARDLIADLQVKVATAEVAQREAEWARDQAQRAKDEANFGREMALNAKEEGETAAYAEGVAAAEALKQAGVAATSDLWKAESVYYPPAIREATPDGAEAAEVAEEVEVADLWEHSSEEVPQEIVDIPSDDPTPTAEKAAALAVPSQAVPSGQGSKGSGVALVQPEQKE
ncbi:uncharacterized protein LOC136069572 [Quercus suber]|uniref:uncharacterized protein LOC136069572 n=1 Tax=Quercus suber TaxID=58331 RepID=UPI0032DEC785